MTLLIIKILATTKFISLVVASNSEHHIAENMLETKDELMSNQVDNWHQLARYDTNIQGELHANLLRNNGITVSLQPLSAIPGMNSGIVLWVENTDLTQAQHLLKTMGGDGESLLAQMSDADLGIVNDTPASQTISENSTTKNGGTL